MRCAKAREILNLLMDGEEHARAEEAREHVRLCAACRQWHAGMERALRLLEASPDVPKEPNIAAAVMARLPARHPASVTRPERRWHSRRVLIWVAAGWLIGVMALITTGLGLSKLLPEDSVAGAVVRAYGSARIAGSLFEGVLVAFGTLTTSAKSILMGMGVAAAGLGSLAIQVLVFDAAVLLVIVVVWRRRRTVAGMFSTLA